MTASTAPIIDRPDRQGTARRTAYGVITAIAWFVYVYLWLPLLTLLAWFLGIRGAYSELYLRHNAIDPFILLALPLIAILCAIALIGWAEYNRVRFQRRDQRRAPALVTYDEVDAALGASGDIGNRLRGGRLLLVALDQHANPVTVNARA